MPRIPTGIQERDLSSNTRIKPILNDDGAGSLLLRWENIKLGQLQHLLHH